ncbi:MAG: hypothetical protein LBV80_05915 [Deltaproteobacteria bacterium]|jgi:hypothetical protein|nr:hypothetical protein [Deltaproteobacteria bacterium]
MTESSGFEKTLARHKEDLARIKTVLDTQRATLESIKAEFDKLGINTAQLPPIEQLPKEYQEQFLGFTRELREIDEILTPPRPASKPMKLRRRAMI